MLRLVGLLLFVFAPLAMAHVQEGQPPRSYALHWSFEPWVITCLAASIAWYAAGISRLWDKASNSRNALIWQSMLFLLGWLTLVIALVSPVDALGVQLFSAHMVQHELMMIVAAPLLVISRPFGVWMWALPEHWRGSVVNAVRWSGIAVPWNFLTNSLIAWIVHALALWVWHVPAFFDAALRQNDIHTWQHASFLISALFFWWTVFRDGAVRSGCGKAILYLFTTMMHTGALGALLTFSATPWYSGYFASSTALGWDPLADQQLGGLIMWIPGGLIYIGVALALGAKWLDPDSHSENYQTNNQAEVRRSR